MWGTCFFNSDSFICFGIGFVCCISAVHPYTNSKFLLRKAVTHIFNLPYQAPPVFLSYISNDDAIQGQLLRPLVEFMRDLPAEATH